MKQYLEVLRHIYGHGVEKKDRTGVGARSWFGFQVRYSMRDGFPAVTTKRLAWKSMVSELLWFISGSNNINDLKSIYRRNKLWNGNYVDYLARRGRGNSDGDMGRIYGVQWRKWESNGRIIDQLQGAIDLIRTDPSSRRILVNAWNPAEVGSKDVALPPCHAFFQFYVTGNRLSLLMYQRSCDMFLGVPLNVASYSLLLHMVARITALEAFEFVHTMGDAHIYLSHIEAVEEQLSREPYPLPTLVIHDRGQSNIDDFMLSDFSLENYQHHPTIRAVMAV